MGDARGHWEGTTLVVDTTNFSCKSKFRGSGENLRLIERFTRTGPGRSVTSLQLTAAVIPMIASPGSMIEFALAGVRADEKRAAEEAAQKRK